MRPMLRSLKHNGILGILIDQNVAWYEGVFVDYFGRPACTTNGLALLALHTGAPVLPGFMVRLPDGRYRLVHRTGGGGHPTRATRKPISSRTPSVSRRSSRRRSGSTPNSGSGSISGGRRRGARSAGRSEEKWNQPAQINGCCDGMDEMMQLQVRGGKRLPAEGIERVLIRGTNWIGDVVMTLPAVAAIRKTWPRARISILAKPWVAEVYRLSPDVDEIIPFEEPGRHAGIPGKWRLAADLRRYRFDCAILLQNAIEAAILVRLADIPLRAGYNSDGRGALLTHSVRRIPRDPKSSSDRLLPRYGRGGRLPARGSRRPPLPRSGLRGDRREALRRVRPRRRTDP